MISANYINRICIIWFGRTNNDSTALIHLYNLLQRYFTLCFLFDTVLNLVYSIVHIEKSLTSCVLKLNEYSIVTQYQLYVKKNLGDMIL